MSEAKYIAARLRSASAVIEAERLAIAALTFELELYLAVLVQELNRLKSSTSPTS